MTQCTTTNHVQTIRMSMNKSSMICTQLIDTYPSPSFFFRDKAVRPFSPAICFCGPIAFACPFAFCEIVAYFLAVELEVDTALTLGATVAFKHVPGEMVLADCFLLLFVLSGPGMARLVTGDSAAEVESAVPIRGADRKSSMRFASLRLASPFSVRVLHRAERRGGDDDMIVMLRVWGCLLLLMCL